MKDAMMSFVGNMAAMGHAIAPDEILRNQLANNTFENYEVAAYKSLLALAEAGGASSSAIQNQAESRRRRGDGVVGAGACRRGDAGLHATASSGVTSAKDRRDCIRAQQVDDALTTYVDVIEHEKPSEPGPKLETPIPGPHARPELIDPDKNSRNGHVAQPRR
jgi:hypothetical protein